MIDYYLIEFWVSLFQILTLFALSFSFFGWLFSERYKKQFRLSAIVFGILNFIILIITVVWPYII